MTLNDSMKKLDKSVQYLIFLVILANAVGLFFPSLRSTFTPYYGSIAKHIVTSGNWSDLMLLNQGWLDKPHLPFWLTAISYKIFGVSSFAYILPGFLFNLIGLYFTYKLARFWYSKEVGLLAVLFTASALHLMLSSIDVRAEAFMLGEIVPACYFWLRYDRQGGIKYLFGGAFFTALGLMTKGPFVIITIISGISVLWIYRGQWYNFINFKWIFALFLSFLLIFPELWALYLQFDLHPEKIIYGQTHVSGIKWFFWDSQFGRFLSIGPIRNDHADFSHYFFFLHTFLWAYLPWWPIFIIATWQFIKDFIQNKARKEAEIFLFASFFVTFILFSVSSFQVDHYTNILFPFASIICAAWLNKAFETNCRHPLVYVEYAISIILFLAILIITPLILHGIACICIIGLDILVCITVIYFRNKKWQFNIVVFPTLVISLVFIFLITVNGTMYSKYDGGYQIANYLNAQKNISVVSYNIDSKNQMDMLGLNFHSNNSYHEIKDLSQLKTKQSYPIYLVIEEKDMKVVKEKLPMAVVEKIFKACAIETYIAHILKPSALNENLYTYVLFKVSN